MSRAVGPLRRLFWLVGFDEMVHAIDDPVTPRAPRTDSIVIVLSTVNIEWVIERLGFEGMLPQDAYNQCLDRCEGMLLTFSLGLRARG